MKTLRRTVKAPVNVGLNQLPEEYAPWNSIRDGYNMIPWEGGLRTRWAQIPSYKVEPTHPNYAIVEMDVDTLHLVEAYIFNDGIKDVMRCVLDGTLIRTAVPLHDTETPYLFDKISVMHLTDKIAICALGYFHQPGTSDYELAFAVINDNWAPDVDEYRNFASITRSTQDFVPDASLTFQLYAGRILILNTESLYLSSIITLAPTGYITFKFNEYTTPALDTDTISVDLDTKITHAVVWNESLIISGTNRQYRVLGSTPETITIKPIGDKSAKLLFTMDRDLFLVSGNSIYVASQLTSEYFIKWYSITTTLPNLNIAYDVRFFPLPFEDAGCLTISTLDTLWFKRVGDSFVFAILRLNPNGDDTSLGLREFLGHRYVALDGLTILDLTYEHSVDKGIIFYPIRSEVYFNSFVPRDTSGGGVVSYDRLRIRDVFIEFDKIPYTRNAVWLSNGVKSAFSEGIADTSLKLTVNDDPMGYSITYLTTTRASLYLTDNTRLNLKTIGYSYLMSKRR